MPGDPARTSSRIVSLSPFVSSVDSTTVYLQTTMNSAQNVFDSFAASKQSTEQTVPGIWPLIYKAKHLEPTPSFVHSNTFALVRFVLIAECCPEPFNVMAIAASATARAAATCTARAGMLGRDSSR